MLAEYVKQLPMPQRMIADAALRMLPREIQENLVSDVQTLITLAVKADPVKALEIAERYGAGEQVRAMLAGEG